MPGWKTASESWAYETMTVMYKYWLSKRKREKATTERSLKLPLCSYLSLFYTFSLFVQQVGCE